MPSDLKKIAWFSNTPVESVKHEIQRLCGVDTKLEYNLIIMDNDECAFILNFDMDFTQDYFVQFVPQINL